MDTIRQDYEAVTSRGAKFGAKIVRGAYMEKERKLARAQAKPDPVNDNYEATGEMYGKVINFLMEKANQENIYVVVATHNEKSVFEAAERLKALEGRKKLKGNFVFAQIYGMGEQITMPLGECLRAHGSQPSWA